MRLSTEILTSEPILVSIVKASYYERVKIVLINNVSIVERELACWAVCENVMRDFGRLILEKNSDNLASLTKFMLVSVLSRQVFECGRSAAETEALETFDSAERSV